MVILLPDTGMRYLSKIYNDEWMKENQYVEENILLQVKEIVRMKRRGTGVLIMARPQETLMEALRKMRDQDISQLPVFDKGKLVGCVFEDDVMGLLLKGQDIRKKVVREAMSPPLPVVEPQVRVESVLHMITTERPAVLVQLGKGRYDIVTKYDIINAVSRLAERANGGGVQV